MELVLEQINTGVELSDLSIRKIELEESITSGSELAKIIIKMRLEEASVQIESIKKGFFKIVPYPIMHCNQLT